MTPAGPASERVMHSRIFDLGVRITLQTIVLFSLFLLFAGHNQPGGGFSGGLVAGAGLVLAVVARGAGACRRILRGAPETYLGSGLLLAAATAVVPIIGGHELLESGKYVLDLPVFGSVTTYSVLAFDAGVYVIVVGLVALVLERLGGGAEE